jgi:hypothetical protein
MLFFLFHVKETKKQRKRENNFMLFFLFHVKETKKQRNKEKEKEIKRKKE